MSNKATFSIAEPGQFTVSNSAALSAAFKDVIYAKPSYNITFSNDKGVTGTLDFNGDKMVFTGEAEESAKVFFDWIAQAFAGRLAEAQKDAARYRWLRSYDRVHAEDDPWVVCWADPEHTENGFIPVHGEDLDATIDQAMK